MVLVWSYLSGGNAAHTPVQVAINDLVILFLYAPIGIFQLGLAELKVPYDTIVLSVLLYIVIPLGFGYLTRVRLVAARGERWLKEEFLPKLKPLTIIGLLLTLIILFSFQGETIVKNPLHIVLIAVPLTIQTYLIFAIGYAWARWWKVDNTVAAPVTVVSVLEEVPIMLSLVWYANRTKHWFPEPRKFIQPEPANPIRNV
jgi:ACR3 family arsenite transporter